MRCTLTENMLLKRALYLDQPMLTLSPDTTQGRTAVLPSDTWMLSGAVVILRSAGQHNHNTMRTLYFQQKYH